MMLDNAVQENGLTDQLVKLALLGGRVEDMADAAQYLETQPDYQHQAILLYHKACRSHVVPHFSQCCQ